MGSALEVIVMKGDAGNEGEKYKMDSKMFSLRDGDNINTPWIISGFLDF